MSVWQTNKKLDMDVKKQNDYNDSLLLAFQLEEHGKKKKFILFQNWKNNGTLGGKPNKDT